MSRIGRASSENSLPGALSAAAGKSRMYRLMDCRAAFSADAGSWSAARGGHKKAPARKHRGGRQKTSTGRGNYDAVSHTTSVLPKRFSTDLRLRFSLSCSTGQGAEERRTSASDSAFRTKAAEVTA